MGLKKDSLGAVIVEILETTLNKAVSKEEKLELDYLKQILNQKATVQKHLFEAELAIAVSGKAAEQWAANYERVAKVKTDYMMAMNVVAKGAGGRDRASSRVAACCCCSVASKVSASIWGSGEGSGGGEGSIGIDQDFSGKLGLSQRKHLGQRRGQRRGRRLHRHRPRLLREARPQPASKRRGQNRGRQQDQVELRHRDREL